MYDSKIIVEVLSKNDLAHNNLESYTSMKTYKCTTEQYVRISFVANIYIIASI